MNRREFLESSTAAAAGIALMGWPRSLAAQMPAKPIGIQVGAVSFLDEGTDKVLDTLAELSSVDTLFLATFRYGRGIAGANGIILSRKYSEMRLDNLRAAGRAIRETVKRA